MSGPSEYIAKLRGLPWSSTVDQVIEFFSKSNISNGKDGVHMTFTYEGRPSGEAFVEFVTENDLQTALERNNDFMGNRYIEVTISSQTEMNDRLSRTGLSDKNSNDGVVRLRGLPFNATEGDIMVFFKGLEIVPNGIRLMTDFSGKKTGEAYVQFVGEDSTELALQKHRERIGHRYIEIFRSTLHEFTNATNNAGPGRRMGFGNSRLSPYDRPDRYNQLNNFNYNIGNGTNKFNNSSNDWGSGGNSISSYANSTMNNTGFMVHMRGLPFKATQFDICDFFKPIKPTKVHLIMDRSGRASGEADVEFETFEDAQRAMLKDRGTIQHRYIELFFDRNGYNPSGVNMPMDMTQGMGIGNCMGTGMTMGMGMDSGMGMGRNMGMGVDSNMGMNVDSTMNMNINNMDSSMGMGMNHRMGVNVRNMSGGGPSMGIGNGMSSRMGSNLGFNMSGTGMMGNNRRMGW